MVFQVLASSFDQMSTSDYSSSNSNTSYSAVMRSCREERELLNPQGAGTSSWRYESIFRAGFRMQLLKTRSDFFLN